MESLVLSSHLAPQLDSPPVSPKISAFRGHEEEPGTPDKPGSPLPDPGSVQRLASRLNERIASEERSRSPAPRRSTSPSPLKLAKEYERQLQRSRSPDSPDRTVPRLPSPLKKNSRISDALAAFQDSPQARSGFRGSSPSLSKAKSGFLPSSAGKSDIVALTMSPKLATRFALKGALLHTTPKGSPEMHSRRRSNRLSDSMPEAFAALREIEDAMRVIERAESPLKSQMQRTFDNTSWEPQAKKADQGTQRLSAAVMSGPVLGFAEEPEEAAPVKHIAKELFPGGEGADAKSPDLGHILAGSQKAQPASEALGASQNRPPHLEHPIEELSTPQKPPAEGADDWEFPQTPSSLTGPVSSKLWASPAVSPQPPPQAAASSADVVHLKESSRTLYTVRRLVPGFVILMLLLAGTALLGAYALPWLMSKLHSPQALQGPPESNVASAPKDMNALAIIPARRGSTQSGGLAEIASSLMEAVSSAIPLPAASRLLLTALQSSHLSADADGSIAQQHLLAHVPFAAMLAAGAFAVYCLIRLMLSSMTWRCDNPCCARRGKVKRRHISGCTMCQRCGQWAARHGGQFWGAQAARPGWQQLPGGRALMCLLRDMGLGFARGD